MTTQLEDQMSHPHPQGPVCPRCGTVAIVGGEICMTCCSTLDPAGAVQNTVTATERRGITTPEAVLLPAGNALGSWPFGAADAEAQAQVAAQEAQAGTRDHLARFEDSTTATHFLAAIPGQRDDRHDDMPSVPSFGPNPFLAAARIQHAHDEVDAAEADAVEAYSA